MAKLNLIKLADLQVNTENYRFEPVASQKEAIDQMVDEQTEKLLNLAEHILSHGLNPSDKIQVVASKHDATKFNVVEGNRRTVCLKVLNNPDLIDNIRHSSLKRKFQRLHDEHKSKLIRQVECLTFDDPTEADIWIKLKHAGQSNGVGTVQWTGQQVERFEEKVEGKSSVALQTINVLKRSSDVQESIRKNLTNLPITNLNRLLGDPDVREFLGVEINNGILQSNVEEKEVVKGLTHIAKNLLSPNFSVKDIYTKDDRKDFIKNFPKDSKPNLKKKTEKPWQFNNSSLTCSKPSPKPKPNPKDRNVLIPRSCSLKISNPKMNAIYHELQRLKLSDFTNVAAIAFRAFVENSMDCFIEENIITTAKDGSVLDKDSKLIKKITEVSNYLEDNKLADKHLCKGIRSAASNKNDLLGIETLHAYVHNAKFSAIPSNMVITWDNIQPFMEKVWANIK
jgi:hypothetical protein